MKKNERYEIVAAGYLAAPVTVLTGGFSDSRTEGWEKKIKELSGKELSPEQKSAWRKAAEERFPKRFLKEIEETFPVWSAEEILKTAGGCDCIYCRELGEGGILNGLAELVKETGSGLRADMKKMPILQETIELCELFDIDPYYALSFGTVLLVTQKGNALKEALNACRIKAEIIGVLTNGKAKTLLCGNHTRFLDRPQSDSFLNKF